MYILLANVALASASTATKASRGFRAVPPEMLPTTVKAL